MKVCIVCGARFRRSRVAVCPLDGGKLADLPDPLVGKTIAGRYVIQQRVGSGGMGTVYRARHEVVGRDVALKFLKPSLTHDPKNRTRFLREAHTANRIDHEHIIDITDFGETKEGLVYLVMEFLQGQPLNVTIAEQGRIDVNRALQITLQIARALGRAHEFDVIHRDIKPENLFLLDGYDGDFVKILDFGLARMKDDLRLTATGTVFGTPEYIAPEQARGASITSRADIYGLGCVLFEMLTGDLLFEGSLPDLILAHMREPHRMPSELVPSIGLEVDNIVAAMLIKDPQRRVSAFELANQIKQYLASPLNSGSFALPVADRGEIELHGKNTLVFTRSEQLVGWKQRVAHFQTLCRQAHPGGLPTWLDNALGSLRDIVTRLQGVEDALSSQAESASHQESEARAARMRIGRALEQLALDEASLQSQVNALSSEGFPQPSDEHPMAIAWSRLQQMLESPLTRHNAEVLQDAGVVAGEYLRSHPFMESGHKKIATLTQQLSDLRFQISQLKGRLASFEVDVEHDLRGTRDAADASATDFQQGLSELFDQATPVVAHLRGFPGLADSLV